MINVVIFTNFIHVSLCTKSDKLIWRLRTLLRRLRIVLTG